MVRYTDKHTGQIALPGLWKWLVLVARWVSDALFPSSTVVFLYLHVHFTLICHSCIAYSRYAGTESDYWQSTGWPLVWKTRKNYWISVRWVKSQEIYGISEKYVCIEKLCYLIFILLVLLVTELGS